MTATAVGLDVGSHVLKALCLEEAPAALRLVSYGSTLCPEGLQGRPQRCGVGHLTVDD